MVTFVDERDMCLRPAQLLKLFKIGFQKKWTRGRSASTAPLYVYCANYVYYADYVYYANYADYVYYACYADYACYAESLQIMHVMQIMHVIT